MDQHLVNLLPLPTVVDELFRVVAILTDPIVTNHLPPRHHDPSDLLGQLDELQAVANLHQRPAVAKRLQDISLPPIPERLKLVTRLGPLLVPQDLGSLEDMMMSSLILGLIPRPQLLANPAYLISLDLMQPLLLGDQRQLLDALHTVPL